MDEWYQWEQAWDKWEKSDKDTYWTKKGVTVMRYFWYYIRAYRNSLILPLLVLLIILVAVISRGEDPPSVFCQAEAPFHANVAVEVYWWHRNPHDPEHYWGKYLPPVEIQEGFWANVRAEGHPAHATIAFTEIGGPRYSEVQCGKYPWEIFSDGFETGDTSGWGS